jgi:acyl-CoA synthetase (AMP-forming)/AMP-acid ligase II
MLFFTSGSTGRPKGVVLSHRANYLRSFQGVFHDRPEISVCMFPLFHMAPFTLALAAWQTRGQIVIVPRPTADALLEAVERRRANRLYCIPAVWRRILEADPDRYDLSSLREIDTGTSATPIELVRSLKQRFPTASLRIFYGSTETGSATVLGDMDVLEREGSVGRAAPGSEIRLAEDGEVCVRSPYLMDEYFGDSDSTESALREGFFHTGDLGAIDADGFLSIIGRKKEIIRTGGESVSPAEVEEVLVELSSIDEVAVVGLPDSDWGEIICAVVVASGANAPSLADLQKHCDGRLAPYKRPRRLEVRKGLPRTAATGQVQRALLVQEIMSAPSNE